MPGDRATLAFAACGDEDSERIRSRRCFLATPTKPWSSTAPPAEFRPYVDASSTMTEFSWRAVILGAIFGALFGAVSVYVGLRAGPHRFRVDSDLRAVDFHPARVRQVHHSRKQYRADHRLGGRVGGRRRDFHFARADLSWVFR